MLQQYKQTIIRCICLLLAGAALQFLAGPADATLLAYPWGVIAAVNYLYLLIILSSNREKWQWVQSLYNRREYKLDSSDASADAVVRNNKTGWCARRALRLTGIHTDENFVDIYPLSIQPHDNVGA